MFMLVVIRDVSFGSRTPGIHTMVVKPTVMKGFHQWVRHAIFQGIICLIPIDNIYATHHIAMLCLQEHK